MDILARLPDSHCGRHTRWLWSRMLAVADGLPPLEPAEIAEHFAPAVFEQVPAEQLIAHFTQLAPMMRLVTQVVEETSSSQRYTALLRLPEGWLRYSCCAEDDKPHLLIGAGWSAALDPSRYLDRRVQRDGRDVQIRDFGGTGPLMLLWHGAGGDLTDWETLAVHLSGLHVIAADLPGHGRSSLRVLTAADALADADAVVADHGGEPPVIVGVSLGGYLGLRYAATRKCAGWIGLDGPFGLAYPWDVDEPGFSETTRQFGREINAIDVAKEIAAINCPAMLLLCAMAANPIEERLIPARRELAAHIAGHHPKIRVEWVQTGHDTILFHEPQETGAKICDFLGRPVR